MKAQHSFDLTCLRPGLEYAARGWAVFPAPPGKKKSYTAGKFGNGRRWGATTDPDLIRQYWRKFPDANVGIACGHASGLLVIECDTPEGHDIDGNAQMRDLIARHGPLPDTIEALSPTGSWHLYFKYPAHADVPNSSSDVAPGIDVRGEGGMVIVDPSGQGRSISLEESAWALRTGGLSGLAVAALLEGREGRPRGKCQVQV